MRQRREQLQLELRRLIDTAAACGHSAALVEAINRREQELGEIAERLLTSQPDSVSAHVAKIRRFVSERLGNIRELLCADVSKARIELAKHVSEIRMLPQPQGKKGHYIATGEWNLLGGFAEGVSLQDGSEKRVRMVAGAATLRTRYCSRFIWNFSTWSLGLAECRSEKAGGGGSIPSLSPYFQ